MLICDPENEFGALAAALGEETATVIHMAAGGKDRLNAMYMVDGYGENNPIVEKSQFIMSLVEQIDRTGVGPQQKSIIDRCTALVYQEAEAKGKTATLCDLRNKLLEQPEDAALKLFGGLGDKLPYLGKFAVPSFKGVFKILYDPVIRQQNHLPSVHGSPRFQYRSQPRCPKRPSRPLFLLRKALHGAGRPQAQ